MWSSEGSSEATSVWFRVRSRRYEVRVPDAEVAASLRRVFPRYLETDGAPADRVISFEGTGGGRTADGIATLLSELEFVLARTFLLDATDAVHLHAAAAVGPRGVVLAAGPSGAGKSSLATHWWARGLGVLGDDIVFLEDDRTVAPFERLFKVHPDRLSSVGVRPTETPFWVPGSAEAWFDPGEWGVGGPAALVAFVQYEPGASLQVRALSRPEALHALVHGALASGVSGRERFDRAADVVAAAEVCEVRFGSFMEAGEYLAREVGA